jgi:hypothetical protein
MPIAMVSQLEAVRVHREVCIFSSAAVCGVIEGKALLMKAAKAAEAILTVCLALGLAGCLLQGNPKTAQSTPAPPKPAVAAAPSAPPAPLSLPQTQVELPPPQPITPEALATTEPQPEEPAPVPVPPKPARTRPSQPARTEAAPAQPVATPPAPEPAAERPLVAPMVPQEEQRQLQADAQHDRQETKTILDHQAAHAMGRPQQQLKRSIESFLQQSAEAEKKGDLRQARELAGRALVLAKELQP